MPSDIDDFLSQINEKDADIVKEIESRIDKKKADEASKGSGDSHGESVETNPSGIQPIPEKAEHAIMVPFTIRGTKPWNSKDQYLLHLDPEKYKADAAHLSKGFYFVQKTDSQELIQKEIKNELMKFIRNPSHTIMETYREFIFKLISEETDALADFFKIESDIKPLFIFHIGPAYLYAILHGILSERKIGYCYRQESGNRAMKFTPDEYAKGLILSWLEENINSRGLQFDSVQIFDRIRNSIAKKYQNVVKQFDQKLYQLNLKLGPQKNISREELLKIKGNQWFGHSQMSLYKRFVGKTIFK